MTDHPPSSRGHAPDDERTRGEVVDRADTRSAQSADGTATAEPIEALSAKRTPRWLRFAKFGIGVALLVAAVWVVIAQGDAVSGAWEHARRASPWLVAAALALPLVNWAIITLSIWLLNGRFARVGLGETGALIAGAWLLNYLPMRPGLIGRVAYHRKHHGITIKQSALVLGLSMGLAAVSLAILLALALARNALGLGGPWWAWLTAPALLIATASAYLAWRRTILWRIPAALLTRYVDLLVWVARYAVVFALVGMPLTMEQAVGMGLVSQLALAVPLAGNGLGLREWMIGLTAGAMAPGASLTSGPNATGLAADLVNRGLEFVVALPMGLLAMAWLTRRQRQLKAAEKAPNRSTDAAQCEARNAASTAAGPDVSRD